MRELVASRSANRPSNIKRSSSEKRNITQVRNPLQGNKRRTSKKLSEGKIKFLCVLFLTDLTNKPLYKIIVAKMYLITYTYVYSLWLEDIYIYT